MNNTFNGYRNRNVNANKNYIVVAKYTSQYGQILYCAEIRNDEVEINLENVYLHTLYYKGREELKVGEIYEFQLIKGENGLTYCF